MDLNVNLKKDFSVEEVSNVIRSALETEERIAKYKKDRYLNICKNFENKYGISSDIFLNKFESGQLDDRDDFFDWYAAKRALDSWSQKLEILSGISL